MAVYEDTYRLSFEERGAKNVLDTIKEARTLLDDLNRKKAGLHIDIAEAQHELTKLKGLKGDDVKAEKSFWQQIITESRLSIKEVDARRTALGQFIKEQEASFKAAEKATKNQIALDNKAAAEKLKNEKAAQAAMDAAAKEAERQEKERQQAIITEFNLKKMLWAQEAETGREVQRILREEQEKTIEHMRQNFETAATVFSSIGSLFSMSGSFAQGLGDSFTQMAGLFKSNFIDKAEYYLAGLLTKYTLNNISNITGRADILNTFSSYMAIAGIGSAEANAALNRVDLSIRGLPIGLDEAAQRLRRYQMITGDLDFAQNLTIGLQKALIAGGAPEYQRTTAYYEIERLLTSGGLGNSRQWMSLINGLGVSVRFIKEALGVEGMSNAEFIKGLTSKDISTDEFLGAIARLGEGTTAASKDLDEALKIYKTTYESWMSNIKFAFTRGGANVLNELSKTLETGTGKSLVGYMEVFRDAVNDAFGGIVKWVGGNGVGFANIVDSIRNLFTTIKGIGFGDLAGKILENFAKAIDLIALAIEKLSTSRMGDFISFAVTLAGPLGKLFKLLGQGLPILMGVFERFKDVGFERIIDALVKSMESFATVVSKVLGLIPDGMLTWLMSFALVWGKPLGAVFKVVAAGISAVGSALATVRMTTSVYKLTGAAANAMNFREGGILAWLFGKAGITSVGSLAKVLGGAGAVIGTIGTITALIAKGERELAEIRKANDKEYGVAYYESLARAAESATKSLNDTIEVSEKSVTTTDANAEAARGLIERVDELNDGKHLPELTTLVEQLNALFPDWGLEIDSVTGKLTENSKAILDNADAYFRAARIRAEGDLVQSYTTAQVTAENERKMAWQNYLSARGRFAATQGPYDRIYADYLRETESYREQGITPPYSNFRDWATITGNYQIYSAHESAGRAVQTAYDTYMYWGASAASYSSKIAGAAKMLEHDVAENSRLTAESIQKSADISGQSIDELTEKYNELKDAADQSFHDQMSGWGELEEVEKANLKKIRDNVLEHNKQIHQHGVNVGIIEDWMRNNPSSLVENSWLSQVITSDDLGLIWAVADALQSGDLSLIQEIARNLFGNEGHTAENDGSDIAAETTIRVDAIAEAMKQGRAQVLELLKEGNSEDIKAILEAVFWGTGNGDSASRDSVIGYLVSLINSGAVSVKDAVVIAAQITGQDGADALVEALSVGVAKELPVEFDKKTAELNTYYKIKADIEKGLISQEAGLKLVSFLLGQDIANSLAAGFAATPITLTPSVRVNQPGVPIVGPERLLRQNGGIVPDYLARGGWPSRGSDIIPAMLTPGEFVQKKAAVEMFGKKFMERVNALDIGGSIDAMSRQFGLPFIGGPFVNASHIRDNHATVNQTNITNNQNFTYKKAFRFASGLA